MYVCEDDSSPQNCWSTLANQIEPEFSVREATTTQFNTPDTKDNPKNSSYTTTSRVSPKTEILRCTTNHSNRRGGQADCHNEEVSEDLPQEWISSLKDDDDMISDNPGKKTSFKKFLKLLEKLTQETEEKSFDFTSSSSDMLVDPPKTPIKYWLSKAASCDHMTRERIVLEIKKLKKFLSRPHSPPVFDEFTYKKKAPFVEQYIFEEDIGPSPRKRKRLEGKNWIIVSKSADEPAALFFEAAKKGPLADLLILKNNLLKCDWHVHKGDMTLYRDERGRSALHYAALAGNEGVVDGLKELTNCMDQDGFTPLHTAAYFGNRICCDKIIKFGCDIDLLCYAGRKAIEYSREFWRSTTQTLIRFGLDEAPKPRTKTNEGLIPGVKEVTHGPTVSSFNLSEQVPQKISEDVRTMSEVHHHKVTNSSQQQNPHQPEQQRSAQEAESITSPHAGGGYQALFQTSQPLYFFHPLPQQYPIPIDFYQHISQGHLQLTQPGVQLHQTQQHTQHQEQQQPHQQHQQQGVQGVHQQAGQPQSQNHQTISMPTGGQPVVIYHQIGNNSEGAQNQQANAMQNRVTPSESSLTTPRPGSTGSMSMKSPRSFHPTAHNTGTSTSNSPWTNPLNLDSPESLQSSSEVFLAADPDLRARQNLVQAEHAMLFDGKFYEQASGDRVDGKSKDIENSESCIPKSANHIEPPVRPVPRCPTTTQG